ncbi:myosin-2 heavy chain-like isoform X2 [Belonocnema kinseyi]|uniref:myosin-2 heavy chain-like isoform X2 n=1 Tax=Belonocnema kinseyi TaxID=2817044 RepID=UPI00143E0A42|nr:myosin-2 heavy chain-like isoform X2 [Belonocnema kinseyi]
MSSIGGKSRYSTDFSRTLKPSQSSNGKEISESEELCSETEGLRILDEFKKLYENRIDAVDQDSSVTEFERISKKFKIMTEWVKDLREQNVMLVRTVEDLEQAAVSRVKLLEDKLLHSSTLVSENIIQCTNSGEALNNLSDRVGELERDEDYLQNRIECLQSDIRGLLELIRRARQEKCWSHEGIQFYEITPADIPAPLDYACDQVKEDAQNLQYKNNLATLQDKERRLRASLTDLEEKLSESNKQISQKDETIKKFMSQVQNLRNSLKGRSSFADHITLCDSDDLEFTESLESREALASEVADKHDQVMSLRKELQLLEEECRHLNMHVQFKEGVIKKLREERAQTKEKAKGESVCNKDTCNEPDHESVIATFLQQFKRMEEFRMCTVEAQAATEDLREEMETVICNFNSRHEKYCELNKLIAEVQNYLLSTKEKISETINQLKLQEDERSRYKDRISTSRNKLKGMKNEINQSRVKFSRCVSSMQENNQKFGSVEFAEIYTSNDVLNMVVDEVEDVVSNLTIFQSREHSAVSLLSELDSQLSTVENNLKKLFVKSQEVLQENEVNQKIFEEREKCIEKSEKELDYAHTNMQDVLETISSALDEINEFDIVKNSQISNQDVNEIVKVKEEYHKLRKEYDKLRMNTIEVSHKKEVDERISECNCRIINLVDQVRDLQNEVKIRQEANLILKNNIVSLEDELNCAYKKCEAHRRSYSTESMELNRKIFDLESTMKLQKEIESKLRRSLTSSELELKKSQDMLKLCHTSSEGTFSLCGTSFELKGVPQSFKVLQETIHQTRSGLLDLGNEMKKLVCEVSSHSCSSTTSVKSAIDMLEKYGTSVESCFAEMEKLRSALYSKDKLLDDKEAIITIQKDTILLTQNELKDLHAKLQDKDQLRIRTCDCEILKSQIDSLQKRNRLLDEQFKSANILWEKTELELKCCLEKQKKFFLTKSVECKISDQEIECLQQKSNSLMEENANLKTELEKYRMDFEIIKEELQKQSEVCLCIPDLKSELQKLSNEAMKLKSELEKENEDLKLELKKCQVEFHIVEEELKKQSEECIPNLKSELERLNSENEQLNSELEGGRKLNEELMEKLQIAKDKGIKLEERLLKLDVNQREIKNLQEQIKCYESCMAEQNEIIEQLKEKLLSTEQQKENCISELNNSKEMICILKSLLKEKSDCMVKLQADYQMIKNDNKIMKMENGLFESKAKEDIYELKSKIKEIQIQLCIAEGNYKTVTQDFNKSQELLLKTVNREAELQQTLTNVEKNFYSKMKCVEKEEARLKDLVNKMREELEEAKEELSSKKMELEQIQSACNLYSSQLQNTHYDLQGLKGNLLKLEETNCYLKQKLQNCREEYSSLLKQKKLLEQNNCKCINELEGMHKSLIGLRKECKVKTKSLASMTVELTQATASRSELCNESQYVVSCIRDWMEEQKSVVDSLTSKLKTKQQQLINLSFEKKALIAKVKEQRRIVNAFLQRRKRFLKSMGQGGKNICKCSSPSWGIRPNSRFSKRSLVGPVKTARKKSVHTNSWFFPRIAYLEKVLRIGNEIFSKESESDPGLDENRDCGYQSSTSK